MGEIDAEEGFGILGIGVEMDDVEGKELVDAIAGRAGIRTRAPSSSFDRLDDAVRRAFGRDKTLVIASIPH